MGGDEADAAYLAKSMEISEAIVKQEFRENVPLKHVSAALAKALVKDSDLMSTASSVRHRPMSMITSIEAKGKKLLESMEATPSDEDDVPLLGPVYLGKKQWCF